MLDKATLTWVTFSFLALAPLAAAQTAEEEPIPTLPPEEGDPIIEVPGEEEEPPPPDEGDGGTLEPKPPPEEDTIPNETPPHLEVGGKQRSGISFGAPVGYADGVERVQIVLELFSGDPDDPFEGTVGARVVFEVSGSGNTLLRTDANVGSDGRATAELVSLVPERKRVTATVTRGATLELVFTRTIEFLEPVPVIESVLPGVAPPEGGTLVTITGARLTDDASLTEVSFGGAPAELIEASRERLVVVAPPAPALGFVDIEVRVGAKSGVAAGAFEYVALHTSPLLPLPETDRLLSLADIDGDGDLDGVITGEVPVLKGGVIVGRELAVGVVRGAGGGAWMIPPRWRPLPVRGVGATALVTGELHRPPEAGQADVLVATPGADVSRPLFFLRGRETGSLGDPFQHSVGQGENEVILDMATAEVDGDGADDVFVGTRDGVEVLSMPSGQLPFRGRYPSALTIGVEVAEVTGDGVLDVVSITADGLLRILVGVGDGTFLPGPVIPAGWSPRGLAVGDLDLDGRPDAVVAGVADGLVHYTGYVRVFRNDGAGGFVPEPFELAVPDLGTSLAIGQLTSDGAPDVAVFGGGTSLRDVRVIPGHGDGTLGAPIVIAETQSHGTVVVRDVTGDGRDDVVTKTDDGLWIHQPTLP